jgi:hypothetical protein
MLLWCSLRSRRRGGAPGEKLVDGLENTAISKLQVQGYDEQGKKEGKSVAHRNAYEGATSPTSTAVTYLYVDGSANAIGLGYAQHSVRLKGP